MQKTCCQFARYLPIMFAMIIGNATVNAQETIAAENAAENVAETDDDAVQAKECYAPAGPIIPDGNVASEDELVAAQKAMKIYQTSLGEYRICLGEEQAALDEDADGFAEANKDVNERYNVSVDAEAAIAEEFNAAVRAFKARQE